MKRRQFIQSGSLMSLPVLLSGMELSAISRSSLFGMVNNSDDKVLVIVQLNGGNDGLNMIIPLDQYSGLSKIRPNLLLPETLVLKLKDKTGIHPSMTGLHKMYHEGQMAVIQSVGYPNQNRSHFRSTDIWTSGSEANQYITTGWVGRYLDLKYPGFPAAYPNPDCPDPFAITLGGVVSQTCQGPTGNFSFTLVNEASVKIVEETTPAPSDGSCYSTEVDFVKNTIKQSNAYAANVLTAFKKGNNLATYPGNNRLADQLKVVANLISGGLGSKIYVVSLGGFDTHANQVLIGEPENGAHATLLNTLSEAIAAFNEDCKALGIHERVMGMTFSEFGRQIKANNSFGTDHGTAAPLIVFGSCVNQGVYGRNPEITADIAPQEGVPMQYDFRSVYASLLVDWLGAKPSDIRTLLFKDFQRLPFVKDCSIPSATDETEVIIEAGLTPNPCTDYTTLNFVNIGKNVHISILNALGAQLDVPVNKTLIQGSHDVNVNVSNYLSGSYFLRLVIDDKVRILKFIKL